MILAVANQKGGVGKTALAIGMADVAARETGKPVLLVDADQQGTAGSWAERCQDTEPLACTVVALPSAHLRRRLEGLDVGRYDLVVLDTPPGVPNVVESALELADVALLPARPTTTDLDRLWPTWDLAGAAGTPALVVLTMARAGTRSLDAARVALDKEGATVAETVVPMREAIAQAFGRPPAGPLADVSRSLLLELFDAAGRSHR